MTYFSLRGPLTIPNLQVLFVSPYLRLHFIKDIIGHFTDDKNRMKYGLFDHDFPFPLQDICDEIYMHFGSQLHKSGKSTTYTHIVDLIRDCDWLYFYDMIEIISKVIYDQDIRIIQSWNDIVDQGIDFPDDYGFDPILVNFRLDIFGFEKYLAMVNELLLSSSSILRMSDDGLLFVMGETNLAKNMFISSNSKNEGELSEIICDDIEEFLIIVKKSKKLEMRDRDKINACIKLFNSGAFEDALNLLFPNIESVINKLINSHGGDYTKLSGLGRKIKWCSDNDILPDEITGNVEFIRLNRNKILHGDLAINSKLAETAFWHTIRWYKMLLGIIN
ncbi:MAG: hypothetical protein K0B06_02955 [Brevefilum sp.]|nr:hypothetical protein [Brevefilum sp.]